VQIVRHSPNHVPYNEKKVAAAADLKKIYESMTTDLAKQALDEFELSCEDNCQL